MKKITIKNLLPLFFALTLTNCSTMTMQESTPATTDNSVISIKARARLIDQLGSAAKNIQVRTAKDEVQLNGFVNDPIIKNRAAVIVRTIPNVRIVRNNLVIK